MYRGQLWSDMRPGIHKIIVRPQSKIRLTICNWPNELEQLVDLLFAHSGLVSELCNFEVNPRQKQDPGHIVGQSWLKGLSPVGRKWFILSYMTSLGMIFHFEAVGSGSCGFCEEWWGFWSVKKGGASLLSSSIVLMGFGMSMLEDPDPGWFKHYSLTLEKEKLRKQHIVVTIVTLLLCCCCCGWCCCCSINVTVIVVVRCVVISSWHVVRVRWGLCVDAIVVALLLSWGWGKGWGWHIDINVPIVEPMLLLLLSCQCWCWGKGCVRGWGWGQCVAIHVGDGWGESEGDTSLMLTCEREGWGQYVVIVVLLSCLNCLTCLCDGKTEKVGLSCCCVVVTVSMLVGQVVVVVLLLFALYHLTWLHDGEWMCCVVMVLSLLAVQEVVGGLLMINGQQVVACFGNWGCSAVWGKCVTIQFLHYTFFLVSVVHCPCFSFAPSYKETNHYLLTLGSHSCSLFILSWSSTSALPYQTALSSDYFSYSSHMFPNFHFILQSST